MHQLLPIYFSLLTLIFLIIAHFVLGSCLRSKDAYEFGYGWILCAFRTIFELARTRYPDFAPWYFLIDLSMGLSIFFFFRGLGFLTVSLAKYRKLISSAAVLSIIWSAIWNLFYGNHIQGSLPVFVVIGSMQILLGVSVLRSSDYRLYSANRGLSIAFIVWGLHRIDYFLLRNIEPFAPYGFWLGGVLSLLVSCFTLMLCFQKVIAENHYLSFHDTLTGLRNRLSLERELKRLEQSGVNPISLVIADLNGLKLTNDAFGHSEGDKLLVKTASILRNTCPRESILGRWGGDEFLIILPGYDTHSTDSICSDIMKKSQTEPNEPLPVSMALGYSTFNAGSGDIQKFFKAAEDNMYHNKLIEGKIIRRNFIKALRDTLSARTHETEVHSERIQGLSIEIGTRIGLSSAELDNLSLLCTLHDIGKIAVPDSILSKSERLTDEEWSLIKRHSEIGYRIAVAAYELNSVANGILYHHERWDGTGYPHNLRGDEIPLLSRIIAIADSFDAMTNERIYSKAMSVSDAVKEIEQCAGTQFDPFLAQIAVEILSDTANEKSSA